MFPSLVLAIPGDSRRGKKELAQFWDLLIAGNEWNSQDSCVHLETVSEIRWSHWNKQMTPPEVRSGKRFVHVELVITSQKQGGQEDWEDRREAGESGLIMETKDWSFRDG